MRIDGDAKIQRFKSRELQSAIRNAIRAPPDVAIYNITIQRQVAMTGAAQSIKWPAAGKLFRTSHPDGLEVQ